MSNETEKQLTDFTEELASLRKVLKHIEEVKMEMLGNPSKSVYDLAVFMHESYLGLSKKYVWKVQENTDTEFRMLPFHNQKIMLELASMVLLYFEGGNQNF